MGLLVRPPEFQGNDKGGEPPDNDDMQTRIAKLETIAEKTSERLAALERTTALVQSDLSSFKAEAFRSFATKADLTEAKNQIIMWVVSAILLAQVLPSILKKFGL